MMTKIETRKESRFPNLKHSNIKLLSPLLVIVLISISFTTTIFLYSSFKADLKAQFPVVFYSHNSDDKQEQQQVRDKPASREFNGFRGEKRESKKDRTFAWSRELKGWTLRRSDVDGDGDGDQESRSCIWPEDCSSHQRVESPDEDRIVDQLRLFDDHHLRVREGSDSDSDNGVKMFKILPPASLSSYPIGQELFITESCPINRCSITYDNEEADVLIFENSDVINEPPRYRRIDQIWVAYLLESPCHTFDKRFRRQHRGRGPFNWTASYRFDSDLVAPYSKFVPYQDKVDEFNSIKSSTLLSMSSIDARKEFVSSSWVKDATNKHHVSLIEGKQGKVAWFASNCYAANNRLEYAKELANYIQVDIYGKCGNLTCNKWNQTGCFEMINKNYKFYLSFENSNCRQYITEKLFRNALGYNDLNHLMLPIVMGAPKDDYLRQAPPGSFIHVDDFESPKELAKYLKQLDSDNSLYYSYFYWKTLGHFIDTKFMCRVCSLLHEAQIYRDKRKSYSDIQHWWTTCNQNGDNGSCCN